MRNIFSIVGRSGSGKTTLIVKLIAELKKRGYRVSVIKHTYHPLDTEGEGKDTWKFRNSGADPVILTNDREINVFSRVDEPVDPLRLAGMYINSGTGIVIVEGFKGGSLPKLEVVGDSGEEPLFGRGVRNIKAVISDGNHCTDLPVFKRDDIDGITDFISGLLLY